MRRPFLVLLFLLSLLAFSVPARAEDSKAEAVQLYGQGRDLIAAGKPGEALPLLERSLTLLPSPNTLLLIAHANRDLGHKAKAFDFYERARKSAEAEIAAGQTRYTDTASEASKSGAVLLSSLGTISVRAPAGARVTVVTAAGDSFDVTGTGTVYSDPGEVRASTGTGATRQEKKVTVSAGATAEVAFEATSTSTPGPVTSRSAFGAMTIAGGVIGGVGLVGLGLFGYFGTSASSKFDELEACESPNDCDAPDLRESGKQAQLIANVSISAGLVLLAGGVALIIVDALNGPDGPPAAGVVRPVGPRVRPLVGASPTGFFGGFEGAF